MSSSKPHQYNASSLEESSTASSWIFGSTDFQAQSIGSGGWALLLDTALVHLRIWYAEAEVPAIDICQEPHHEGAGRFMNFG